MKGQLRSSKSTRLWTKDTVRKALKRARKEVEIKSKAKEKWHTVQCWWRPKGEVSCGGNCHQSKEWQILTCRCTAWMGERATHHKSWIYSLLVPFSQVAMTGYPGGLTSLHSMAIAMKNCWTFQEAVLPSSCNETFLKVLIFCLLILSRLN